MSIYINGIGTLSASDLEPRAKPRNLKQHSGNRYRVQEPDYTGLANPMQIRRMSRVVKMGLYTAKQALQDAGIEKPDLITTGTAYGCLADTELFLQKMILQQESMLTPTSFIQSTHNTVSGQIALMLACHGHNFTFVQGGHSFESSLDEAMMWLKENSSLQVLAGGVDETTEHSFGIISRFRTYKNTDASYEDVSEGTVSGEGSNMFLLSTQKSAGTYAVLKDIMLCMDNDPVLALQSFLKKNNLDSSEIDTCMAGYNGDTRYDKKMDQLVEATGATRIIAFKKYCGEYPTSGSFALALAGQLLLHKSIPAELNRSGNSTDRAVQNLLICNHYKDGEYSFILLQAL